MRIVEISQDECSQFLARVSVGRLACALDNQPYIIPISFAFELDRLYLFSTLGKKVEWMRQNPKVCLQADEIVDRSTWVSVVVNGTYIELREPDHIAEKEHARKLLAHSLQWWLAPMAGRREQAGDLAVEPVLFRLKIDSLSGLRATPES
jgi:uncharacterized protein